MLLNYQNGLGYLELGCNSRHTPYGTPITPCDHLPIHMDNLETIFSTQRIMTFCIWKERFLDSIFCNRLGSSKFIGLLHHGHGFCFPKQVSKQVQHDVRSKSVNSRIWSSIPLDILTAIFKFETKPLVGQKTP